MNEQQRILAGCAVFAFGITLLIYEFAVRYFLSYDVPYIQAFLVAFLASGAIYTLLFRFLMIIYSKLIFYFLSPTQSIRGTWHHITTIREPVKEIRYGDVCITNDLGAISVTANNYNEKDEYRSSFHSIATYLDPTHLTIFYKSEGALRPQNPIRNGMMELTIVAKKGLLKRPVILKGSWKDTVPSTYSGSIIFFSNEEEWKAEKQKEIERIK